MEINFPPHSKWATLTIASIQIRVQWIFMRDESIKVYEFGTQKLKQKKQMNRLSDGVFDKTKGSSHETELHYLCLAEWFSWCVNRGWWSERITIIIIPALLRRKVNETDKFMLPLTHSLSCSLWRDRKRLEHLPKRLGRGKNFSANTPRHEAFFEIFLLKCFPFASPRVVKTNRSSSARWYCSGWENKTNNCKR